MRTIIQIIIIALFALSVFWGMGQETVQAFAFDRTGDVKYPYWWDRAEPGLIEMWDRLEDMGVWDEYR